MANVKGVQEVHQPDNTESVFAMRHGAAVIFSVLRSDTSSTDPSSLTPGQRRRWESLQSETTRSEFLLARSLGASLVATLAGVEPSRVRVQQTCAECGEDDHGSPYPTIDGWPARRLSVSWSHSDGVVAAVAGRRVRVGVDIECRRPSSPDWELLQGSLVPADISEVLKDRDSQGAFLKAWTTKEALVKLGYYTLDYAVASSLAQLLTIAGYPTHISWRDDSLNAHVAVVFETD